jgi:hypothetical protein
MENDNRKELLREFYMHETDGWRNSRYALWTLGLLACTAMCTAVVLAASVAAVLYWGHAWLR